MTTKQYDKNQRFGRSYSKTIARKAKNDDTNKDLDKEATLKHINRKKSSYIKKI